MIYVRAYFVKQGRDIVHPVRLQSAWQRGASSVSSTEASGEMLGAKGHHGAGPRRIRPCGTDCRVYPVGVFVRWDGARRVPQRARAAEVGRCSETAESELHRRNGDERGTSTCIGQNETRNSPGGKIQQCGCTWRPFRQRRDPSSPTDPSRATRS